MVALNGVLGALRFGSCLTRLCSVASALGPASAGLLRKALVMAVPISDAVCHMGNCWRTMLPMVSAPPFAGATAVGELGARPPIAPPFVAAFAAGGGTSRGVALTSYSALLIAMPAPPSIAA